MAQAQAESKPGQTSKPRPEQPKQAEQPKQDAPQSNNARTPAWRKEDYIANIEAFLRRDDTMRLFYKHLSKDNQKKAQAHCLGVISLLKRSKADKNGKALWTCTPESIVNAVIDACRFDLVMDGRGYAYLTMHDNQAEFAPGYKGYIQLVTRANPSVDFQVELVYVGDEFSSKSVNGFTTYEHVQKVTFVEHAKFWEKLEGIYCFMSWTDVAGRERNWLERISKSDLLVIRGKAKTRAVWDEFPTEQCKKSVIRRATKVPFAAVVEELDAKDNDQYDMEQPSGVAHSGVGHNSVVMSQAERDRISKENFEREAQRHAAAQGGAQPMDNASASAGEVIDGTAEEVVENPAAKPAVTLMIPFLPEEQMQVLCDNLDTAWEEMKLAVGSTPSKAERKQVIEANAELIGEMLKAGNKTAAEEIHKLADEGEDDAQ